MKEFEIIQGGSGIVVLREKGGSVLLGLKLNKRAKNQIIDAIRAEIASGHARRIPLGGGAIVAKDGDIPNDIREWCIATLDEMSAIRVRRHEIVKAVNAGRKFIVRWKPWCGRLVPMPGNSLVATVEWLRLDGSVIHAEPASDAHLDASEEVKQ